MGSLIGIVGIGFAGLLGLAASIMTLLSVFSNKHDTAAIVYLLQAIALFFTAAFCAGIGVGLAQFVR